MPTGVHIRDARQQLFDAAERVIVRDGPRALTSRAVTSEAGVAKGVLHRHFVDFDDFLVEFVRVRLARIDAQTSALRASAGTGAITDNLTSALVETFDRLAIAIVCLVISRDDLRTRLRSGSLKPGVPVLSEATSMLAAYLTDECELGRLAADTDTESIALSLIGAGHLLFAGGEGTPPSAGAVHKTVVAVTADVLQRRLL